MGRLNRRREATVARRWATGITMATIGALLAGCGISSTGVIDAAGPGVQLSRPAEAIGIYYVADTGELIPAGFGSQPTVRTAVVALFGPPDALQGDAATPNVMPSLGLRTEVPELPVVLDIPQSGLVMRIVFDGAVVAGLSTVARQQIACTSTQPGGWTRVELVDDTTTDAHEDVSLTAADCPAWDA